jgi:hypothetical protein
MGYNRAKKEDEEISFFISGRDAAYNDNEFCTG